MAVEVSTPREAKRMKKKTVSPNVDVAIIEAVKKEKEKPTVMDADVEVATVLCPS